MRKTSLFILLLLCSLLLQAKQTIIKGHFQYKPDVLVNLQYYANPLDYIESVRTNVDATVDAKWNFTLRFDINHPVMINLKNGGNWLFLDKFILPGDSVVFDFDKDKISYEGNCEGRFKVQFDMDNELSLTDNSYQKLEPVPFAKFWNERRLAQYNFLVQRYAKEHFPDEFMQALTAEINYSNAVQVVQFIMRHCSDDMRLGTKDPNFLGQIGLVKPDDPSALVSTKYLHYLRELPYNLYTGNMDRRQKETPEYRYYSQNQYRLRDSIAKRYFKGVTYDLALYSILREVVTTPGYVVGTSMFDTVFEKTQMELKKYAGSFTDQNLYRRLEKKLHSYKEDRKEAPDFKLVDLNDKEVRLAEMKGKVVYIDFWATTCVPCREELPYIKQLQQYYSESDLVMLFVSLDNDKKLLEDYVKAKEFKGTHLFDVRSFAAEVAQKYQISSLPRYVLIDKRGKLITDNAPRPSSHPEAMIDAALRGE